MLKIIYHGHSALEVISEKHNILIDPFITGNPKAKVKASALKPDFIILTHAHGDHFGDTIELAKNNDATVIATHELSEYLITKGCKSHGMGIGGQREFDFGKVKFTIAHHSNSLESERLYMGEPAGVIINTGGKTIYHAGDTGLFLDMKLIGEMHSIDHAFLPIGDNYTMGIDDAVKAAEFINCKTVSPVHYGTFPVIDTDPNEFRRKIESIGKKCVILPVGEEVEI